MTVTMTAPRTRVDPGGMPSPPDPEVPEKAKRRRFSAEYKLAIPPYYFSLIDTEGNRVAGTQSINFFFGSGLMVPGTGRQIVGWVGVAMLISSLTGLWLWWPVTGSFRRGFRWKRQNATSGSVGRRASFFAVGFVLLASLFAATASMVSRQEDIGSTTTPVGSPPPPPGR